LSVRALVVAVLAVVVVAPAGAEPAPLAVALALSPCAEEVTPGERLVGLLQIELAATLEQPIALAVAPVDAGVSEAALRLSLDCTETRDVLELAISRREPPGSFRGRVNLGQLPERMRPRTIALAIAEDVRWLDAPRAEAAKDVAATTTTTATPPPPVPARPLRNVANMRLARNWMIGLGVSGAALAIVGGPLLGAGDNYHPPNGGLVASGTVLVTLSVIAFAGSGVSFWYWWREWRRPVAAQ
jgi:hypothetical protein